ncbi:MAG: endo-inulinase, partial [Daejeonella sp.]|nr:endo-inulinase [Daejeonella sp.]
YQRTPNGSFKTQMHWGHMSSTDLINWTNTKDALWPELNWSPTSGYDEKGIWSGDVIMNAGVAHAFYTCVNNSGSLFNPGIGHATSSDAALKTWTKTTPVVDRQFVADFRDPYIFKDGTTWVMIIGARTTGSAAGFGGGLDCYTSSDLNTWTHKSNFTTIPYDQMDPGSEIWEMPVFESFGNGKYILIANPIGGIGEGKYGSIPVRGKYWIGTYVNGQFTPDLNNGNYKPKNLDLILGHLSPTVERNAGGQLVGLGIVDERRSGQAQEDAGWCHLFSLPRVYSLLADNKTLGQAPAPQATSLRSNPQTLSNIAVNGTYAVTVANGASTEIMASLDPATTATRYGINIRKSVDGTEMTRIYYEGGNIVVDKTKSSLSNTVDNEDKVIITEAYDVTAFGKPQSFHVFIDNSIIDVFINEKAAFSARIYPTKADSKGIELFSEGATTTFTSINTWSTATVVVVPTSVTLNKTTTSIKAGRTETLVPTVLPANATDKNVNWTSSNTAVATVVNGVVTGIAPGTATITVTTQSGAKTATCTVTVTAQSYVKYDFESGNLTGWTTTGTAFTNAQVTQDATYWEGRPFNQQGLWHFWGFKNQPNDLPVGDMKTSNFTLGGDGLITFRIGGGNLIDSTYIALCNSAGTVLTKVTGSNDEGYTVKSIDGTAYLNTLCFLKVVDIAKGGFGHINVDDIMIPIATATVPVTSVTMNKSTTTIIIGKTDTLIPTVNPANATNKTVTWASNNTAVATVNASGVVTAVTAGTARITVTTQDGAKTAFCDVTVIAQPYLVLDFETGKLTGFTPTLGNAFSDARVANDATFWGGPFNQQGTWHMWGFKNATDDTPTGEMKTQNFTLSGDGKINLLIAGGTDLTNLYIALCNAAGTELVKATGTDNEAYTAIILDGSAYINTSCFLKVKDNTTAGFGHINLDNIRIPTATAMYPVISVALNKATTTLITGTAETLTTVFTPSNATNKTVTWSSNNTAVATVNASGVVTAVAAGTARITAITQDGARISFCDVTVVTQPYLTYNFETGTLNGWTVVSGTAFSNARVANDVTFWGGPFNQQGTWHMWGFKNATDDTPVGVMRTTANFTLSGNGQISLMIAGGTDLTNVYIALCNAAGTELVKATGTNNEAYTTINLNGAAYIGTSCYLKVVDNSAAGFGHINLDNIVIPVAIGQGGVMSTNSITQEPDLKLYELEPTVKVYPVPASDNFYVDLNALEGENIQLVITDLFGKLILKKVVNGANKYQLSARQLNMNNGLYIINVTSGGYKKSMKILINGN